MNRFIMIYGCVLLSSSTIAAIQGNPWGSTPINEMEQDIARFENQVAAVDHTTVKPDFFSVPSNIKDRETYNLDISTIKYIEEEVIELGFDPYDYLPEHFNPYSVYFDLNSVEFIDEEYLGLDFDTAKYLPAGFDADQESTKLTSIHFIEEEDMDLGFNTEKYLPRGFSPYEPYFDLNTIHYIEMEGLDDDYSIPFETDPKVEEPF